MTIYELSNGDSAKRVGWYVSREMSSHEPICVPISPRCVRRRMRHTHRKELRRAEAVLTRSMTDELATTKLRIVEHVFHSASNERCHYDNASDARLRHDTLTQSAFNLFSLFAPLPVRQSAHDLTFLHDFDRLHTILDGLENCI